MERKLRIDPPLLNSSSPWATTFEDLKALYASPFTGAITTRTCLQSGFNDRPDKHQHCFFEAGRPTKTGKSKITNNNLGSSIINDEKSSDLDSHETSSLNTYGYSPLTLDEYLGYVRQLVNTISTPRASSAGTISSAQDIPVISSPINPTVFPTYQISKPIIISVTGTPDDIIESYRRITAVNHEHPQLQLAMEINLSCPNIAGKPPPAYDAPGLEEYLAAVAIAKDKAQDQAAATSTSNVQPTSVFVGIKLPPYTHLGQFEMVVQCLRQIQTQIQMTPESGTRGGVKVIDFITSTNTLGSSLVLDDQEQKPVLDSEAGTGIGGMAGAAIHALSLGNVATLRRLLDMNEETRHTTIIGVGGVSDHVSFAGMRAVGADAVGVATALGRVGVGAFGSILNG